MSPYARQFASQLEKPDLDLITGLPPTVAIEQRISRGGGKSTVGTVTEIYHFLRLLFAKVGIQHCPQSGEPVISQTPEAILKKVQSLKKKHKNLRLLAPVLRGRKGFHKEYALAAEKAGFDEMFIDGQLIRTEDFQPLARHKAHDIDFVISSTKKAVPLKKQIETALHYGNGTMSVNWTSGPVPKKSTNSKNLTGKNTLTTFSTQRVSPVTGESFEELDPHHFSFNSPRGWCPTCRGYGHITGHLDPKAFNSQTEAEIHEEKQIAKADSETLRPCPDCHGSRLRESSRHVFLPATKSRKSSTGNCKLVRANSISLPALSSLNVKEALTTLSSLKLQGREKLIARDILPEITQRLEFLDHVGLGYLQLDRSATTLSGGESQRIRLAAQLGSNLQGVLYILDEPTIGLHPRDNTALLKTLQALKAKGNSLLLVEHDEDTIRAATHLIDLGPAPASKAAKSSSKASPRQ